MRCPSIDLFTIDFLRQNQTTFIEATLVIVPGFPPLQITTFPVTRDCSKIKYHSHCQLCQIPIVSAQDHLANLQYKGSLTHGEPLGSKRSVCGLTSHYLGMGDGILRILVLSGRAAARVFE